MRWKGPSLELVGTSSGHISDSGSSFHLVSSSMVDHLGWRCVLEIKLFMTDDIA